MKPLVASEDEYEDLLGQWSDLESGLAVILAHPDSAQEFEARIRQYGRWLQDLSWRDADLALYLLFQLASHSPVVGYSASHALVCGVLCHLLAEDFDLPGDERACLVHAAFTMNVAMTELQNQLAAQQLKPSAEQQILIGKPNFFTGSENAETVFGTEASMYWPFSIYADGNRLVVADTGNHRILLFTL